MVVLLALVLTVVGGVSFVVARTIRHGIGHRQLPGTERGPSLPTNRTAVGALITTSLTVVVSVPLLFVTYEALA